MFMYTYTYVKLVLCACTAHEPGLCFRVYMFVCVHAYTSNVGSAHVHRTCTWSMRSHTHLEPRDTAQISSKADVHGEGIFVRVCVDGLTRVCGQGEEIDVRRQYPCACAHGPDCR
jgi:hypothetical protein